MIGILLAYLKNGGSRALTAVGLLVQNGIHIFIYRNSPVFCAIVFAFTVIFALCILFDPKEGKPALWKKAIVAGADISFVFYLTHEYIGWAIMRMMDKAGMTSEIFLLIPIVICIALAYVLHYGIEKRILSKLPKLSSGKAGK